MSALNEKTLEKILGEVEKPGRYAGGEWNEVKKDFEGVEARIALIFPDVYEIGMSYLGQKILYAVLNRHPAWLAERAFAPWPDFELSLRQRGLPLFSLESRRPLREFDILGFSLLYELNYSNILTVLDLAGIPFFSRDRKETEPLVIAGGPAAFNPEPVSELFDAFLIGDGEEAFPEMVRVFLSLKKKKSRREEILAAWAQLQGVYVPNFYAPYEPAGSSLLARRPTAGYPLVIRKRTISNLNRALLPEKIVVPNVQTVFDRVAVEIARGCPQKCRFCQATSLYHPFRCRSPREVVWRGCRSLAATGYEDVSLSALSAGDYPWLDETVEALMGELESAKISLSVSSLRPKGLSTTLAESIAQVRKTGFTLAPEAGTARLRQVINKSLSDEDILRAAENAFQNGWRLLKLYFMIGLPTERESDLQGIVDLVEEVVHRGKRILHSPPQLNITLSSFIPKPHTPFQWVAMETPERLREKQDFLRRRLARFRSVRLKEQPVMNSVLEAIFSRGDCRLGNVIIDAWRRGARFDGWKDLFDFSRWEVAFETRGLDYHLYLGGLNPGAPLPWSHIDSGMKNAHLLGEWEKALREEKTLSCFETDCRRCQGCALPLPKLKSGIAAGTFKKFSWPSFGRPAESIRRYVVFYSKTGPARFLSHLDTIRQLQRALRRAGVHPAFSSGFHPKMLITYAPALPLGMEGREECFEFRARLDLEAKAFVRRMNRYMSRGIRILRMSQLEAAALPLQQRIKQSVYSLNLSEREVMEAVDRRKEEMGLAHLDSLEFINRELSSLAMSGQSPLLGFSLHKGKKKLCLRVDSAAGRGWRSQDIVQKVLGVSRPVLAMTREKFIWSEKPAR